MTNQPSVVTNLSIVTNADGTVTISMVTRQVVEFHFLSIPVLVLIAALIGLTAWFIFRKRNPN
jgi:hypothetical protein